MKLSISAALRITTLLLLPVCAISAQQSQSGTGQGSRKTMPSMTMDDLGSTSTSAGRNAPGNLPAASAQAASATMQGDALSLLPASDVVAVIDVQQAITLLLPKMNELAPGELLKMKRQLDEFMNKTGIDPLKITRVTLGFTIPQSSSSKASGAIIIQGIQPDPQKLMALLRAEKVPVKTISHQGQMLLVGTLDSKTLSSLKSVAPGSQEIALATLTGQGIVLGDLGSVKSVLDTVASGQPGFANALLGETLNQTNLSGLVRFSAALSDSFRQTLRQQGELGAPFATVRVLAGSLAVDPADGSSMTFDLRARTGTASEAAQLDTALKGLVALGKSFLGSGEEVQAQLFNQLLDQVKITNEDTDVTLSFYFPKSLMDRFKQALPAASSKRNVAVNSRK